MKTCQLLILWLRSMCFYPTFEEWKLGNVDPNHVIFPRFYPTFEEWKPPKTKKDATRLLEFLSYLWGMKTELNVLKELPLRSFLSYLWGMKTSKASSISFQMSGFYPTFEEWKLRELFFVFEYCHPVSILPLRNENYLRLSLHLSVALRFYPTFEEWKLGDPCTVKSKFKFLSYLWGMKNLL